MSLLHPIYLSEAEDIIIEAFRKDREDHGKATYEQALIDVSGILSWLTTQPEIPREKLAEYVISEFDKAIAKAEC